MINTGYGSVQALQYTDHKNHVKRVCKHCLLKMLQNSEATLTTTLENCYPHVDVLEQTEEEIKNQTVRYAANLDTIRYCLCIVSIRVFNATEHRFLHEGYIETNQEILNRYKCSFCRRSLREDCTDY